MEKIKHLFLQLLKKAGPKALIFAVAFIFMITLTGISLVKIHSTGGMAKAVKDAEIAYNYAVEKDNKNNNIQQEDKEDDPELPGTVTPSPDQTGEVQTYALSEEQLAFINDYYSTSAFVGDSVMLGFSQYCEQKGEEFLGGPLFLVAGSFSLRNALIEGDSPVLPTFKGEKTRVEDAVEKAEDIDKVFLFFGINDFNVVQDPVNDVFENYVELIGKILDRKNVQINVISTTYILNGKNNLNLTNENIVALNEKMKSYCEIEGFGYVNIADATGDSVTGLKEEYCSDQYVHQTTEAYGVWANVLQNYALSD